MRKVIFIDEPKKEKKPIEITHCVNDGKGWTKVNYNLEDAEKVVYLGYCKSDGDLFSIHFNGYIEICKGHLNDGYYESE